MVATQSRERRLYRVDEAIEAADGLIGRSYAYEEIRRTGKLLGVDVIRAGRKILIPRQAFDKVLDEGFAGKEPDGEPA